MPGEPVEWMDADGEWRQGRNQLTVPKERELRAHIRDCATPLKRCKECWLLYRNIGQEAYNQQIRDFLALTGKEDRT